MRGNEVIRTVAWPSQKVRLDMYQQLERGQAEAIPEGPKQMVIYWRKSTPQIWTNYFGKGSGFSVRFLINILMHVSTANLAGEANLADAVPDGDLLVNADASQDQLRVALAKIISQKDGFPVEMNFRAVARQAVVFTGSWDAYKKRMVIDPENTRVMLLCGGSGRGGVEDLARVIGNGIGQAVIFEATDPPRQLFWRTNGPVFVDDMPGLKKNCDYIRDQTGLTWSVQTRSVRTLFIERAK